MNPGKKSYLSWLLFIMTLLVCACADAPYQASDTRLHEPPVLVTTTPRGYSSSTENTLGGTADQEPCIEINCLAPDFILTNMDGNSVRLADYRGKSILLNFWATWCDPCRRETPLLEELSQKYQDQDFVILGISTDEGSETGPIYAFMDEFRLTYPILHDPDLKVATDYQASYYTRGIPFSYFIDYAGVIRDLEDSILNEETLEVKIQQLIGGTLQATPTPEPDSTLTIQNLIEADICEVFFTPVNANTWGPNRVADSPLSSGQKISFAVRTGMYDFQIYDCMGAPVYIENQIAVFGDFLVALENQAAPDAVLRIINNTEDRICQVFISSVTSSTWGANRLQDAEIAAGEAFDFAVASDTYDIRLINCDLAQMSVKYEIEVKNTYELAVDDG